ncbi:MAG: DUF2142 domain-containing protein [Acidimicrobiia bacterium]
MFVASAAWSIAFPPFAGPDERAHAIEAAAVVRGQILGDVGAHNLLQTVRVPEAYRRSAHTGCYLAFGEITPACVKDWDGGSRLASTTTYQFRGSSPLYYAVVGLPTFPWPGETGTYVMRLVNAAMCSALLALALAGAIRSGAGVFVVGAIAAVTPEVLVLAGVLNPNGLEAAAAIALWVSLLRLRLEPASGTTRVILDAGIAGAVLVVCRGLSPLYAAVIVIAALALAPPGTLARLRARSDARRWALAVVVLGALNVAWTAYVNAAYPLATKANGFDHAVGRLPGFGREIVALVAQISVTMRVRDLPMPNVFYVIWAVVVLGLVGIGTVRGSGRDRVVLAAVVVVTVLVPVLGDAYDLGGQYWRGRHVLALACGIPLVAGAVATNRRRRPIPSGEPDTRRPGTGTLVALLAVAMLLGAQCIAFVWSMHRYAVGIEGSWSISRFVFDPRWSPPLAGWLLIACFAGALVLTYALALGGAARVARIRRERIGDGPDHGAVDLVVEVS